MNSIEFIITALCSLLLGFKNIMIPIYIFFIVFMFNNLYKYYKKEKNSIFLLKIIIFGCILPDNYTIIAISVLLAILLALEKNKINIKIKPFFIVLILYVIINMIINGVKPLNFLFAILYNSTMFIAYYIYKNIKKIDKTYNNSLILYIKQIVLIEFGTVIIYALTHIQNITNSIDYDWVVGTFGEYQGNITLFFMFFCFIMFEEHYKESKDKKDIVFMIISMMICIMTGSIALLLFILVAYIIGLIFEKNSKFKFIKLGFVSIAVIVFLIVTPEWIKNYIIKLTDINYFKNNITKIETYEKTFVDIPKNDLKFLIFGNGIGQYSSRAALTCTGIYIDKYSKIFEVSMSDYTKEYIYPILKKVMMNHLGSMSTPYSSLISIQGEYGIIGIILFVIAFCKLFKNSKNDTIRIYLIFLLLSLFIENYLEFAKIIFVTFLVFYLNLNIDMMKEEDISKHE